MINLNIWVFGIASIATWLATGTVRKYALHKNLLDIPNQRSSHAVATPRGGGLGIVIIFLSTVLVLWWLEEIGRDTFIAIICGGSMIGSIGFADDHIDVPAGWRLLIQTIAAILVVLILDGPSEFSLGNTTVELGSAGNLLTIVAIVWFTNAFNFMDGIDGLAASESICIAGGAVAICAMLGNGTSYSLLVALIAVSVGFIVWNWPPAKIFLGDVGSAFLGFVIFTIAIVESERSSIAIWSWLILAGVFIVDATFTLTTRMITRENWLSAHRNHAYQKASRLLASHRRVTLAVIGINIVWLVPIAYVASAAPQHGWWLTLIAWMPLLLLCLWLRGGLKE